MDYSSGCESGWTMYLGEQSAQELTSVSERNGEHAKSGWYPEGEGSIEDLSMVSDASSGPPMFHEEEEDENCSKESVTQKYGQWKKMQRKGRERHDTLLDDTASSHALGLFKTGNHGIANQKASADVVEFSVGLSFTDCNKGKSAFQEQYTYLQVPPPGKATPAKPVYKKESRRNKK